MIGFILVTHRAIGQEMLKAIEEILKERPPLTFVGFDPSLPLEETRSRIRDALKQMRDREGVIILTDIFGATPSNLCTDLCAPGRVQMLTGCNLPMVLKAATGKFEGGLEKTVEFLKEYGRENIRIGKCE